MALFKALGACGIALGAFVAFVPLPKEVGAANANQGWIPDLKQALQTAKDENKIVLLDLYADWCAGCIEFDMKTFSNSEVKAKLKEFITARVDFTQPNETTEEISTKYHVEGLPTLLFLRGDGTEISNSRVSGFMEHGEFVKRLEKVK